VVRGATSLSPRPIGLRPSAASGDSSHWLLILSGSCCSRVALNGLAETHRFFLVSDVRIERGDSVAVPGIAIVPRRSSSKLQSRSAGIPTVDQYLSVVSTKVDSCPRSPRTSTRCMRLVVAWYQCTRWKGLDGAFVRLFRARNCTLNTCDWNRSRPLPLTLGCLGKAHPTL